MEVNSIVRPVNKLMLTLSSIYMVVKSFKLYFCWDRGGSGAIKKNWIYNDSCRRSELTYLKGGCQKHDLVNDVDKF